MIPDLEPEASEESEPVAAAPEAHRRVVLPEVPGLAPEQVVRALNAAWRAATAGDGPTAHQLAERDDVERLDVDETAGYIAVTLRGETVRAIGVRREFVAPLVALIAGTSVEQARGQISKGPSRIEPTRA